MTIMFRMCVALILQSISNVVRAILFLFLGIVRPLDYLSDWLQKVSVWFATDERSLSVFPDVNRNKDE